MSLKFNIALVVAPVQNEESIAYLDSKMSEHPHRFQDVFPNEELIPKHQFLKHRTNKGFWTWDCSPDNKHSQFKQIVRHTGNFEKHTLVLLADMVTCQGTRYSKGMIMVLLQVFLILQRLFKWHFWGNECLLL